MSATTQSTTSTTDQWQPPAGCLPKDFFHGFATASYQVEGAHNEDGRAPSVWDDLTRVPGAIADGSNGDEAVNSYHMTEQDVAMLAEAGCNAYRLSISWSRLIPQGGKDDPVNPQGVAYYNKLIDTLLAHGIKPFITLFHWDLPTALEKRYRGWSNREIVADFERYCRVIFENFGDRVKNWITLNEPFCVVMFSKMGLKPDYSHDKDCYIISHHLILAHARAVDAYKRDFQPTQKGTIGITLNCDWCEPFDSSAEAKAAAQRRLDFSLGLYADPIYRGHYPESMQELCPKFTEEEWKLIKGSSEFFGLNSYSTLYVSAEQDPEDVLAGKTKAVRKRDGKHIGNEGHLDWLCDVPWGFGKLLVYIEERYMKANDIPLIVTEQGFCVKDEHKKSLEDIVQDTERIDYYRGYLKEVLSARSRGMKITGYFAWSFVDNFEWLEGYIPRFGTVHVDRESKDFKRTRKESNKWLQAFFERATKA